MDDHSPRGNNGPLAQGSERLLDTQGVGGSRPPGSTKGDIGFDYQRRPHADLVGGGFNSLVVHGAGG